jgi:phosphoserine phosphatase
MNHIKVYFIRHGQTKFNVLKKIQGSSDIPLTDEGIKQAYNCNIDKNVNFDIAYHSSLSRSKDTLEIICNKLVNKPEFHCNDLVIERGYGIFEGLTEDDIKEKYDNIHLNWLNNENTYIENAETIDNVVDRIKNFLNLIVLNKFKNVLVVTHSGFLFALYKYITNMDLGVRPKNINFPNCSVQVLDIFYSEDVIHNLHFHISDQTYKHSGGPTKTVITTSCC